jgi:hypothetical protein
MTVTLPPDLAQAVSRRALESGKTPEEVALDTLRRNLLSDQGGTGQDPWIERLRRLASPAEVSHTEEALSRENLYD